MSLEGIVGAASIGSGSDLAILAAGGDLIAGLAYSGIMPLAIVAGGVGAAAIGLGNYIAKKFNNPAQPQDPNNPNAPSQKGSIIAGLYNLGRLAIYGGLGYLAYKYVLSSFL